MGGRTSPYMGLKMKFKLLVVSAVVALSGCAYPPAYYGYYPPVQNPYYPTMQSEYYGVPGNIAYINQPTPVSITPIQNTIIIPASYGNTPIPIGAGRFGRYRW